MKLFLFQACDNMQKLNASSLHEHVHTFPFPPNFYKKKKNYNSDENIKWNTKWEMEKKTDEEMRKIKKNTVVVSYA